MSEQILLKGKLLGTEPFLLSSSAQGAPPLNEELMVGRSQWITLLCEVLPRALLSELKLARILLGSSGGGQFLIVLPQEAGLPAREFLSRAAAEIGSLSGGHLKLLWSITENLGDWAVIRKRLNDDLQHKRDTPLADGPVDMFQPFMAQTSPEGDWYCSNELGRKIREASSVGWSPDSPGKVLPGAGKHMWNLTPNLSLDGITLARHAAPSEDGRTPADLATLGRRAQGRPAWGVLRGDVDNFGVRLRRLQTIEEHVQLSVLYKQFFVGELEVLCSLPEFWRKVTILYSGGDDFAVYGSWDALIHLAREMQRLFHRFTEENLKDFPGAEGKTISMALALAPDLDYSLAALYGEAGRNLELAKSVDKDCIYLLGRVLEWKQLASAADLKEMVMRMIAELRASRQVLFELRSFYGKRAAENASEKVWRFHYSISRALGGTRDREVQRLRTHLISEIVGRKSTEVKLRPAGLVALEWARLFTEV